jgi:hypothetical protein
LKSESPLLCFVIAGGVVVAGENCGCRAASISRAGLFNIKGAAFGAVSTIFGGGATTAGEDLMTGAGRSTIFGEGNS